MTNPLPSGRFIPFQASEREVLPNMILHWYSHPRLNQDSHFLFVHVHMLPGQAHEFHFHPQMEEMLYILSGTAEEWIEQENRIVRPGDAIYIPSGAVHGTYNIGDQTLEFLAVLSPANSGEPSTVDVSRQEPWNSLRSGVGRPTNR